MCLDVVQSDDNIDPGCHYGDQLTVIKCMSDSRHFLSVLFFRTLVLPFLSTINLA